MDPFLALRVLAAAEAKGCPITWSDLLTLYAVKAAGKVDTASMVKAGTFDSTMQSLGRAIATINTLREDKDQAANVPALLESLGL